MKYFLRIFFVFALLFSIISLAFSLEISDISLKIENLSNDGVATFEISLPKGWKLAKPPKIVSKYNPLGFKYLENLQQISPNKYRTRCKLNKNQKDVLKFDFFVCKKVCSVVSKDFSFTPVVTINFFWMILLFGFIGGLLLNVTPCILPVILLKMKHLHSRATIINSIIGNYLSFLILALALFLLRISGETVGWGLHFQNVYFLKFAVIIFFIFSLITFGKLRFYWNINLNKSKISSKMLRDIISSVMTTMIAIPCTAPVLGTAATFAIQESFVNLFSIFMAIATGFSVPYFVALFWKFPFKKIFQNRILHYIIDYGVVITFFWLCWILFKNINPIEIIIICLTFLFALFLFKKERNTVAIVLLISTIFVNIPRENTQNPDQLKAVSELVKQNKVVILNITADWCLSCKYNKIKLNSKQVQTKIQENNVKFIEIDITKKNDKVIKFIHEHSRVGIPFTIVYGPKNRSGVLLSEILDISEIIKTIDLVR